MTFVDRAIKDFRSWHDQATINGKVRSYAFWIVLVFWLLVLTLIVTGEVAARYLIPAMSAVAAYLLYRISAVTYVSFVWWLWFLTSFVRRLVDYRCGFEDHSLVLTAPYLASLVCIPALFNNPHIWKQRRSFPFLLAFSTAIYGALVGLVSIPQTVLISSALGWFAPLVFGFYILSQYTNGDTGPALFSAIQRTFCWGLLVMGTYGVAQYFLAPGWDCLWMTYAEPVGSMGIPEPLGMRVFSTMNGPGAFSFILVAGLLLLTQQRGLLPVLASAAGYLSLLLTSVRTAWLAWFLAMLLLALRGKQNLLRIAIGAGVLGACLTAVIAIAPLRDMVIDRFQSFTDMQDDSSFQERRSGYEDMTKYALSEPFGSGLGTMDAKFADKTLLGSRDSGFWEVLLSLGWIGGAIYIGALGVLIWGLLKPSVRTSAGVVAASISVGLIAQIFLSSVMLGVTGAAIWMFAAIGLSDSERVRGN